ncbi:MAG: hypothetical protein AAGD11_19185 [Planctomycetota bacterium]
MRIRDVLAVATLCVLVGCGDSGPFDYVPVTGKLSYEDGSLISDAQSVRLGFVAMDRSGEQSQRPRPAKAPINLADGSFDHATSYKYGDGLVPGKHRVVIVARDKNGRPAKITKREYTSAETSPLVVDTADAPFDIKIPKP